VWPLYTWVARPRPRSARSKDMTRTPLLPILALAATAAAPTASALADHPPTVPATKSSVKIEGGYAYYDNQNVSHKYDVIVVVKTRGQAPRRWDGLIRAGGTFGGHGGGSVGSVAGRSSKLYTFTIPLKDMRFYTNNGTGAKAKPGRYKVTFSAKDASGTTVSSTKTITLRHRLPGDRAGKPLL
jgi:hypothetical protein